VFPVSQGFNLFLYSWVGIFPLPPPGLPLHGLTPLVYLPCRASAFRELTLSTGLFPYPSFPPISLGCVAQLSSLPPLAGKGNFFHPRTSDSYPARRVCAVFFPLFFSRDSESPPFFPHCPIHHQHSPLLSPLFPFVLAPPNSLLPFVFPPVCCVISFPNSIIAPNSPWLLSPLFPYPTCEPSQPNFSGKFYLPPHNQPQIKLGTKSVYSSYPSTFTYSSIYFYPKCRPPQPPLARPSPPDPKKTQALPPVRIKTFLHDPFPAPPPKDLFGFSHACTIQYPYLLLRKGCSCMAPNALR